MRMALVKKNSSSRSLSQTKGKRHTSGHVRRHPVAKKGTAAGHQPQFAVCVCNDDYPASLELRKLYQVVEDDFAQQHDLLRVIDESGEDYMYPETYFVRVDLPKPVEQTLHRIA